MPTSPNKKMIYVWEENLDFFEELASKKEASTIINKLLSAYRNGSQIPKPEVVDRNMVQVRKQLGYPEPTDG